LINQTYADQSCYSAQGLTQWQQFEREILRLQQEAPRNVEYKLLWIARHGEGWHNGIVTFQKVSSLSLTNFERLKITMERLAGTATGVK